MRVIFIVFNRRYSRYPPSWDKINVTLFLSKKLPIEEIAVEFVYSINRQQEK